MQVAYALLCPVIQELLPALMDRLDFPKRHLPGSRGHWIIVTVLALCQLPVSAAADPEEAVANPLAGMRLDGVWGQPVPSAVRAPPQPPVQLIRPPPSQANTASSQPNHAVPPEKHQVM